MKTIDINCDLGEGTGNEAAIMPYISSCSIACGGHYGDINTIASCYQMATEQGVKVGAHPSYPDRVNFGRKTMPLDLDKLQATLRQQLDLFFTVVEDCQHIKPHGALYNDLFFDQKKALAVVDVFLEYRSDVAVYCPPNSALATAAKTKGLRVVFEGFGDRSYSADGQLVSRSIIGGVLTDHEKIGAQVIQMVTNKTVTTLDQKIISLPVKTICLHGDGKRVIEHLSHLTQLFTQNQINVQYF
ncbi:MAG: 5-oxoprolinase subunit PxpA [Flavobacteriaceae bacterium]